MIISVDDNLNYLIGDLRRLGYTVYTLSQNHISDYVIYSGKNTHFSSISVTGSSLGTMLINGDSLSTEQLLNIISSRSYSTLF